MVDKFKLKDIEIRSFRGIKNTTLELNDSSLVLVGANGSGKSSIVNAFEYLFTGKVESLSGTQSIKHDEAIVYLGDEKSDLSISANINNFHITRKIKDFTYSDELEEIVKDLSRESFLLNRKKLLSFIESTPGKRYETITPLIGFKELNDIENILSKTAKNFNKTLKEKKAELTRTVSYIAKEYDCEINEIYEKINLTLIENNLRPINSDDDLNEFLKEFSKNNLGHEEELNEILENLDTNILEIDESYQKLLDEFDIVSMNELKSSNNLIELLNRTEQFIANENPSKCPICQNEIESPEVIEYINSKKEELDKKSNLLINWKNDCYNLINELKTLNTTIHSIKSELNSFKEYNLECNLDEFIDNLIKLAEFEINPSSFDRNYLNIINDELNSINVQIKEDLDGEKLSELNKVYNVIFKLNNKQELESEISQLERQANASNKTSNLFKTKKQQAVEKIISKIEQLVNDYYNFIHDHEEFNSPTIDVPKSTTLKLNLNFNNVEADPRSYSSEGHLDSLGLCIFLAFVKTFNKLKFVILDDIISTVDLEHKERIAMLLLSEFNDYQFIITTHSNLWFRQLKNYVHNYNLNSKYIFAEIRGLDPLTGPVLTKHMMREELIDRYIEMGDTFAAGNAIRRYLENIFETICRVNQIPLPLKQHYMVDDYFKVIKPFILDTKLLNSNAEIKEYYQDIFDTLNNSRYMGNLLSHDDDANLDVSINEVIKFRDAVYEFKKSMSCWEKHDSFLKFDPEHKYAFCSHPNCMTKISFKKKE